MSQEPRIRLTNTGLRLIQRLRLRGTMSSVRRTRKRQAKTEARLELLRAETRHQLLLSKELEEMLLQQMHRLQELSPLQQTPQLPLQWLSPETPQPELQVEPLTELRPLALHRKA